MIDITITAQVSDDESVPEIENQILEYLQMELGLSEVNVTFSRSASSPSKKAKGSR